MGESEAGAAKRAHLPDFLHARRDAILAAWVHRIRSLAPARCLSEAALFDHFGQVIDRIADGIESTSPPGHQEPPRVHALDRLGRGFDLRDVVHEYAILRRCVHDLWRREVGTPMPFDELDRLETAIDAAIADAAEKYTQAQAHTLKTLNRISEAALGTGDVDAVLQELARSILQANGVTDMAIILLCEGDDLRIHAMAGIEDDPPEALGTRVGEGLAGKVVAEGRPIALDSDELRAWLLPHGGQGDTRLKALYGVPLLAGERVIGVACLGARRAFVLPDEEKILFRTMVERASTVVVQAGLIAERRKAEQEREKAMAALRAEQNRLSQVLHQLPAGVIIADRAGKIVYGNDEVARIWRSPLIPSERVEEYGAWQGFDPVDGHPLRSEEWALARALAGERILDQQVEIKRGDGTRGYISNSGAPLRDEAGRIVGGVVAFYDITAQKEAEKQRDRLMDEMRFLSEVSEVLNLSLDYDKTLARLTRLLVPRLADWCSVDMVREDGTIGDFVAVAHGDPAKVALVHELRKRYPTPQDASYGVPHVLRTGEPEWLPEVTAEMNRASARDPEEVEMVLALGLRSYLSVPLNARGRTFGVISLAMAESGRTLGARDLALSQEIARRAAYAIDNARLYRIAREASAVRDNLLAIVSHDLKNLLGTIVLSGAAISRSLSDPTKLPKAQRAAEVIQRTGARMDRLIHDLVDVAQIQMGRLAMVKRMHDPAAIVAEAAEAFSAQAQEKGLTLEVAVERDLPEVSCDRERVLQVLSNLLSNAIKVTPAGGAVAARCGRRGEDVCFSVSDTGPGIVDEELPHVFERYFRGQRTEYKGMGLGLAIVKGIVDAHGGWVKADSRVGEGATFSFGLPAAANTPFP
ncbi:ATP-binding protein [Polyangium aurulentum]|uniref:ATP-binding protein n=1 Tax=Polyangium aurulentum TaxID=2567896 RepID=UPI00146C17DE|nr:ATP-binding protein [Polyangium aurulentum]UQA59097.1 GAF domain-containing protein [Polyangium aurulentum]